MPTEVQEALGAAAHRMVMHQPHIVYGTQFDRFAWTVPPDPIHADCSGAVSHVYWDGCRIRIGGDTGAIARDVAAGKAMWVNINDVRNGDIVMRRSGNKYDGGSDEHMGKFEYRLTDGRPVTFESAGSKNGVGYYPRPTNYWRDGVRYHATDLAPDLPDEPDPLPIPIQEDDMFEIIKGANEPHVYMLEHTNEGRRRRWLQSKPVVDGYLAPVPSVCVGGGVINLPQVAVDQYPFLKGTKKPDGTIA